MNKRLIILDRNPVTLPVACGSLPSFGALPLHTVKYLNRKSEQKPGKYSKYANSKVIHDFNTALQCISFLFVGKWYAFLYTIAGTKAKKECLCILLCGALYNIYSCCGTDWINGCSTKGRQKYPMTSRHAHVHVCTRTHTTICNSG